MTVQLLTGNNRSVLATLDPGSVQTVVTSPPYFGLRDYGVHGQIGLERTIAEYVANLVDVFRAVRRVLRDDGTVWLNLGDSFTGGGGFAPNAPSNIAGAKQTTQRGAKEGGVRVAGLASKNLIGIPWRVAFALQDDGWILRRDIIWHKPNPMPESVKDRPTGSHEYIFLFAKQPRYFYDADAVAEPITRGFAGSRFDTGKTAAPRAGVSTLERKESETRNQRDVWTIATKPYAGAHFATFPPEIPRRCILAGSRSGDTVLDPFSGAGTTALVADQLGRHAIGVELKPAYTELARARIEAKNGTVFISVETKGHTDES